MFNEDPGLNRNVWNLYISSKWQVWFPWSFQTVVVLLYCCISYHALQASTLGMMPPRYAWITYGWYPESFWRQNPSNGPFYQVFDQCSREQIMSIVNQMIIIQFFPRYDEGDRDNPIIGNLVRSKTLQCRRIIGAKCTGHYLEYNSIWKRNLKVRT